MYTFKNVWKKTKIREKMEILDFCVFSLIFLFFSHFFKGMNKENSCISKLQNFLI